MVLAPVLRSGHAAHRSSFHEERENERLRSEIGSTHGIARERDGRLERLFPLALRGRQGEVRDLNGLARDLPDGGPRPRLAQHVENEVDAARRRQHEGVVRQQLG